MPPVRSMTAFHFSSTSLTSSIFVLSVPNPKRGSPSPLMPVKQALKGLAPLAEMPLHTGKDRGRGMASNAVHGCLVHT